MQCIMIQNEHSWVCITLLYFCLLIPAYTAPFTHHSRVSHPHSVFLLYPNHLSELFHAVIKNRFSLRAGLSQHALVPLCGVWSER